MCTWVYPKHQNSKIGKHTNIYVAREMEIYTASMFNPVGGAGGRAGGGV